MRRRSFLKLIGWTSAWAALAGQSAVSAATSAAGQTGSATVNTMSSSVRYRAEGGRIYVSSNSGQSWTLHSDLGSMYRVDKVGASTSGSIQATVDFAGRTFTLRLAPDLRWWLTA